MASSSSPLMYTVRRCQPELVVPSMPTPHEIKLLSDIDDQEGLRFQIPIIQIYRYEPLMAGKDPVKVIRKALARTLVFYYPFAGRLKEGPGRKLMVDCTGEGVMFIEADADVTLGQFGEALQPPFSCYEELLYDVPGTTDVIDTPLLLIQVTRLKCGGFILGSRFNHTMSDAAGIVQFMNAVAEIARGASEPSIPPVWRRELLNARNPPRITCNHHEYEQDPNTNTINIQSNDNNMVQKSFFFGPSEIATIRPLIPRHLKKSSTFEVLTAFLWRCRTKALQLPLNEEVRMMCIVNARGKFNPPMLPIGYYGNGFVFPAAVTTSGKLCSEPFGYALELIKRAKAEVTKEYIHSVADLMVIKGRPLFAIGGSFLVSDLTRAGLREVDFGWGKALYSGVAKAGFDGLFSGASFYVSHVNAKGEEGIGVPICLPFEAMERFTKELNDMLGNQNQ